MVASNAGVRSGVKIDMATRKEFMLFIAEYASDRDMNHIMLFNAWLDHCDKHGIHPRIKDI
jgi:hypothetical protein